MTKIKSDIFHVVLSPKLELDMNVFINWCKNQKLIKDFVVAKEWGKGANPHLDATVILNKSVRQDNFRKKIIQVYDIPENEKKNIKVIKNTIDNTQEYYIGYTLKEGETLPDEYYSTITDRSYLQECRKYYYDNVDRIEKCKNELKKVPLSQLTVDRLFDAFVEYLTPKYTKNSSITMWQFKDGDGRELDYNKHFKEWYLLLDYKIPHSLYSKINQRKFVFHAQCEIERMRNRTDLSLDCPNPQT